MTTRFKHENIIKIAGVLGTQVELRSTANGTSVATSRQESERHRVIVWGMQAEKAARLLSKGSKIRVQGRMTYPTWKDNKSGETRYGAEIVATTLDYV
jgi:single-stranded DNA-binding protein